MIIVVFVEYDDQLAAGEFHGLKGYLRWLNTLLLWPMNEWYLAETVPHCTLPIDLPSIDRSSVRAIRSSCILLNGGSRRER